MLILNNILKKYELRPYRYQKNGNAIYVDTNLGKYVVKSNKCNHDLLDYLKTRSFNYFPHNLNNRNEEFEISEYIEETNIPVEQKMLDLIDLVALLHSKTTHFKEVEIAHYKELYEDLTNNIAYLYSYYTDLITLIESKVFMSPSEYLLARNISEVYASLNFCKREIDAWYELVKDKKKDRFVVVHNNLKLDHFLRNTNSYLISWNKAKIDKPIFDLYKLYKRQANEFDFVDILNRYEKNYPLLEEERKLFFILIALPDRLEMDESEYELTKRTSKLIEYLYKTEKLISPYYFENTKNNN